jgi:hypothetical protein
LFGFPRDLSAKEEGAQAILDDMAQTEACAKEVYAQELIDNRYLAEMEKSAFFDQLWAKR